MPQKINMNYTSANAVITEYFSIKKNTQEIIFDFSKTTWLSAEFTPFLGVLVLKLFSMNKDIFFNLPKNGKVRDSLEKNGFMETYGIKGDAVDSFHTTIPYTILNAYDDQAIDDFLESKVFRLIHQYVDANEIEVIRDSVNEISHNVKDHSEQKELFFCGQHYPQNKYISLSLTDNGITIPSKVRHKFSSMINLDDSEVIDWATDHGNSTKKVASSGLGLFDIKNNITGIGSMIIISNFGYWEQDTKGKVKKFKLKNPYPGTLISVKLLRDDHPNRIENCGDGTIDNIYELEF